MILVLILCALTGECREERIPLVVAVTPWSCVSKGQAVAAEKFPDELVQRIECRRRK